MSYTILNSDGTTLLTLADQSYDNITTSLTLVGKNSNAYGQSLNQNFVSLLENFANVTAPRSPVTGQLWFNTLEGRMFVYSTSTFKPVGGATISTTVPGNLVAGDFWIDSANNQLWYWNGAKLISSSKSYADSVGKAGWLVETVQDVNLKTYIVSNLYNNGVLLASLTEQPIILNSNYTSVYNTSTLKTGLTLNTNFGGIRFNGTATSADSVAGFDATSFIQKNTYDPLNNVMRGPLFVSNNTGTIIGTNNNLQLYVDSITTATVVYSAYSIQSKSTLDLRVHSTDADGLGNPGQVSMVTMVNDSAGNHRVGILNSNPVYPLDIVGDVRINGNIQVLGTQTIIETQLLQVADKNIELGSFQTTSSDAFVNSGGIILHGTTDHTFLYNATGASWDSSDHIQVHAGKAYFVNVTKVIDESTVYSAAAPNLLTLGVTTPMTSIEFSGLTLYQNTITTVPFTNLIISPSTGLTDLQGTQITNMKPTTAIDTSTVAATKGYVDGEIALNAGGLLGRKPYTLSIDTTYFLNPNQDIKSYLDKVLPIDGGLSGSLYRQYDGAICTVLAITYSPSTATSVITLNKSYIQLSTGTNVLEDVAGSVSVTVPPPVPTYVTKLYQVSTGTWTYIRDIT
jgi:hypothetical protein